MTIEFLGNKTQLIDFIYNSIEKETINSPKTIIDLFSGTGVVSSKFKKEGYQVIANDFLLFCTFFAKSYLLVDKEPSFLGIINNIPSYQSNFFETHYDRVINFLNEIEPAEGFIYKNYSPASEKHFDIKRMYFSEQNAGKIDAIRQKITEWEPYLTEGEKSLLITDLLRETVNVSNIAGTYGSYMKYWKKRALATFRLTKSDISPIHKDINLEHIVYNKEANDLVREVGAPIIYADPPYTKRQYSAYYHILETIAHGDNPEVTGKTGLRPWEGKNSDYCYKRKAPSALHDLVSNAKCNYFFMSYNSDGQISHENIIEILSEFGNVTFYEQNYKRYKSNNVSTKEEPLKERLYVLKKKHEFN